ncbi:MAG: FG-GAP-like repeat-containing protein [Myxococcota bacterium]|nr:FG-GAP-like repeat-containing protein [Myxococcota bacterium]
MRHSLLVSLCAVGCLGEAGLDVPRPKPSRPQVPGPTLISVDPETAPSTGGETLTIRGDGFSPRIQVAIAGVPVDSVGWLSPGEVRVRSPTRLGVLGRVPVQLTNPDGGSTVRDDVLSYFAGVVQFLSHRDYPFGVAPIGMTLLDVNADGRLDLLAAFEARGVRSAGSAVSVLLGRGDGTFAHSADYPAGSGLYGLAVGDVSGDGQMDIAMANSRSNTISLYLGRGDGTFGGRLELPTGAYPTSVIMADLDGDRRQDLVTANAEGVSLSILLSRRGGHFEGRTLRLSAAPWALAAGDVNGDGHNDLVVSAFRHNEVSVLLGNGDGSFVDLRAEYPTGASPHAIALGDLNGDGKLDLAVANRASNTATILLGKGDGTFAFRGEPYVGNAPFGMLLGDINGDRRLDLVAPCYDLQAVSVLIGQGDGRFSQASFQRSGGYTSAAALGDVNGDGLADVVVGNSNATYSVILNASL